MFYKLIIRVGMVEKSALCYDISTFLCQIGKQVGEEVGSPRNLRLKGYVKLIWACVTFLSDLAGKMSHKTWLRDIPFGLRLGNVTQEGYA